MIKKSCRKSGLFLVLSFLILNPLKDLVFANHAHATQVAFFRQYTPSGQLVKYEANGQFAHIAISYQGGWLHAHPYGGVQWSPAIENIGFLDFVILENKAWAPPTPEFAQTQLQKKFDIFASWFDPMKTYCSKLVAEFFKIPPQVMRFSSKDWQGFNAPKGHLGLSPDDIYHDLLGQKDFLPVSLDELHLKNTKTKEEAKGLSCSRFLAATF